VNDEWIAIPRWDEFQHYGNRDPVWIKNYLRLLRDDNYLELTLSQRGILHGLWMLYAVTDGALKVSVVKRDLVLTRGASKYFRENIEALNQAGFIAIVASKPLARPSRAKRRVEKKEPERSRAKPETPQYVAKQNVQPADPFKAITNMIRNGVIHDRIELDAEIAGYRLNGTLADELREMLPR